MSGTPGVVVSFGSRSSFAASARNNGLTSSAFRASRSPSSALAGSAAQAAKSGIRSSTPTAMFASQPRATRDGSGSSLLSRTQRSVCCGYFCAYSAPTYVPYDSPHADSFSSPSACRKRSMSRTSLAVVRLRRTGPPLRAHASAVRRALAMFASIPPSAAGQDRSVTRCRSAASSPQLARVLPPTPRGSRLTRSYAPPNCPRSAVPLSVSRCTPDPPGPPGITMSAPRRAVGLSLRSRDTARVSCGPSGRL